MPSVFCMQSWLCAIFLTVVPRCVLASAAQWIYGGGCEQRWHYHTDNVAQLVQFQPGLAQAKGSGTTSRQAQGFLKHRVLLVIKPFGLGPCDRLSIGCRLRSADGREAMTRETWSTSSHPLSGYVCGKMHYSESHLLLLASRCRLS